MPHRFPLQQPRCPKKFRPVFTEGARARLNPGAADAFLRRIRDKGTLSVIIGLRMKLQPEDGLSATELRSQNLALGAGNGDLLDQQVPVAVQGC